MEQQKKILLIGNYSCSNRGDMAILHGLFHYLSEKNSSLDIEMTTLFPKIGKELMDLPLIQDEIMSTYETPTSSFIGKLNYNYLDKIKMKRLRNGLLRDSCKIPARFNKATNFLKQYDAVIQVGGSYYVDLYGPYKYVSACLSLLLTKPLFLAGHSLGPFTGNNFVKELASTILPRANKIYIRESETLKFIGEIGLEEKDVELSADTAWLIPDAMFTEDVNVILSRMGKRCIALTARNLKAFEARLGVSQEIFEQNLLTLLDHYINKGFHILGIPMVTKMSMPEFLDDREVLENIRHRLENPDMMSVVSKELNHLEFGALLSECDFLIGTRLHSVILSLRYGTPAIALYYEHKSKGVLDKMKLSEFSFMIAEIGGDKMISLIDNILANPDTYRSRILNAVEGERVAAAKMIDEILSELNQLI